jgi:hypothetical protein
VQLRETFKYAASMGIQVCNCVRHLGVQLLWAYKCAPAWDI